MSSVPSPAAACSGLTKRFGPVDALAGLTLSVPSGSVFGLLGPNGAGKTTLIRILLGLTRATSGSAELLGHPAPAPSLRPRIGYMPQELALYLDLPVEDNLGLFGRLYGLRGEPLERRTAKVLELVRLTDRRRRLLSELSGGLRRRVSFAAALLPDPELLFLDEPTVGVDPELREEFWEYFHAFARRGRTIVLTTHYLEEAGRCDQVALLYSGRLLADGTPGDVRAMTGSTTMDEAFLALVRRRPVER